LAVAAGAAAAFSVASTSTSASALDATDTWRGSILVTNVSAACALPGFPVKGQTLVSVFRPKLASGQPNSALLISFANGAFLGTSASSTIPAPTSGKYVGDLLGGVATYGHYTGGRYDFTITPATIVPTTPQVTIKGKITKFRNTSGCTLTFKGSFFKGVQ